MPDGHLRGWGGLAGQRQADRAFARLEERVLLAAQPVVDVTDQTIQLGNTATVTVSFDNQPNAAPGGDVGYAPYVDLVLPKNGADGGAPGNAPVNDGVPFLSASYLGAPVEATVIEFDNAGQAVHPFARDASGNPLIVRASDFGAAPGDELVVLRLPFGSFVADQPRADIAVSLQLSPLADIDQPLVYGAQGGFAYGLDPLNNPTVDPPIRGPIDSAIITPNLFSVTKTFSGPEAETATGPNFPRSYTITFDLAAGQTVTDTILRDVLPDGIVVTGPPVLSGAAGTAVYDPATHTLTTTIPGPTLGVAGAEITVILPFYVGEFLDPGQPGTPVLNPPDGGFRTITNDVSAEALWTPLDGRDPTQVVTYDPQGPENTFTAKSIAVQKSQSLAIDVNAAGLGPGDTIEYVIQGQVSDYFAFGSLVINDLLSDGQSFLAGSATLGVTESGGTLASAPFLPGNVAVSRDGGTGLTAIAFNLSDQLIDAGAPDGVLTGSAALGAATFTITFRTTVDRFFVATGEAVGQGDSLSNSVTAGGDVIGPGGTVTGSNADTSGSNATIATGSISKEIYALNGTILAPGTPVSISSGDEITFRLTYAMPQTLAAQLDLRDFLPLPVFDTTTFTLTLEDVVSAAPPPLDTAKWGPLAGGFDSLLTEVPVVTLDTAANSLTFTFRNLQPATPTATVADVLFTLKVADRPFGDGLLLTNQLQTIETSASGAVTTQAAIRQLTLNEPNLDITKGVVAFDGSPGVLAPTPPGPVTFTAPGSSGVRFSGVIDSTNLALTPINSDLLDMDAGDRVTFAIVVENTGRARNGAFDVTLLDNLPQGFVVGPGGLNLQVTDGAGNPLAYTASFFPGGGSLTLTDPGPSTGALAAYSPTGGANIVVITYDLVSTNTVQPRSQITNLAEIENYAAFEGGVDRVPNTQGPTQDTATVTIGEPTFEKTIVDTSVSQTQGADLTIGETITYELVTTLREGRVRDLVVRDILPGAPGRLDLVDATVTSIGASLFERNIVGNPGAALAAPIAVVNGQTITFTFFNDIVNVADNVADAGDQIRIRVTAVAANVAGNIAGTGLENTGALDFLAGGSLVTLTDTAEAKIVGPVPTISKTADRETVQGGDVVTYTVDLALNTGANAGPAFDITATDPLLPGSLTYVPGSLTLLVQPTGGASASVTGGIITVTAPVLLPGERIRLSYQATVEPGVVAGSTLPNTVAITADSYPGTSQTGVERVFTGSASDSVRVPGPGIVKTVSAADTSLPETGSSLFRPDAPDLAIGEEVTYRLTVTLPEAVSTGLVIRDLLPGIVAAAFPNQGLFEYLSAAVVRVGASLSGPGLGSATPVGSDSNGDGIADTVTIAFGDVTNTPDGTIDAGDEIEVTVTARVRDAAVNSAGQAPINLGEVLYGGQTQRASAIVDIVEPNLVIDKDASATTGDAGDVVTFTVSVPAQGANAGPAFNVTVTDTVPVGFTLVGGTLALVNAIPGATLSYDSGTRLITAVVPTYLANGPQLAFRYDAIVDNSVRPAEVLTNLAEVTFTSSPGTPPDAFQRDYGPLRATESFTIDLPTLSKRVVATDVPSTDFRPGETLQDVVVGETVTYLVTLRLPEVTTNLVISDFLPVSEGAPPSAGDMRLISASLVRIGANITGASMPAIGSPGVQSDSNGDGIVNTVSWNFGTVTNLADNVQDADDLIIVEVVARVINVTANQPGDRLINTGQAQFSKADGSNGLVTQTETIQIVGPELAITKTPSVPSGDAGDIVTYTVTVNHVVLPGSPASTADAYGVVIDDLLTPGLTLVSGTVTANLGATVLTGNGISDTTVRVGLEQYARLPATPLIITYQARLTDAVRAGETLSNTADLDWQSAPTGFPDARTDAASANANVAVVMTPAIDKAVTGTSLPETPGIGVEPGETITYTITLTLGEGTQRVLLTDVLPVGTSFVGGAVTAVGSNISGALLGVGATPVVVGQGLSFNFGNAVVNAGDNVLDARDRITVQVTARVLDVPGNTPGTVLTNNARFTTDTGTLTDTAPVTVVAPSPVITKGASIASGDAGDLVTFTVVVAQQAGATGPLYDLNVTDALGSEYVLVAGSAVASRGVVSEVGNTVTLVLSGAALLPTDSPGTPGVDESRITLTYQARLADGVQPGDVVTNVASFTGSSAPTGTPGARPFAGSDDAVVTVVMPVTLDKQIVATSLPGTPGASVGIGETVTYRLTATLSEGTQTLVIADTLPAGLDVVSTSVATIGAGITAGAPTIVVSGQGVSFDFGTVVNAGNNIAGDGTVAVEIVARVRDVPGNASGTNLTNSGTVTITAPDNPDQPGGRESDQDNTTATVVVPDPVITKGASIATGDAGDLVTFTVVVSQQAGGTGPLYDLNVTDALGAKYVLVSGSATASRGVVGESGNTVTLLLTGLALEAADNPGTPGVDESRITLTYQARLADGVQPGDVVTNIASFTGSSAPSGTPEARPFFGSDDASVKVVMPVTLEKAIVATSLPGTADSSVGIGETVTYRLTATLSEGTQTLVIADTLPAGLEVVSTSVASVGAGVTAGAPTTTVTGQGVRFDFGTVVNTGNNILGDGTVAVDIVARVRDVAGNASGTVLTNAGTVTITAPDNPDQPGGRQTDQDTTTATVVVPNPVITKGASIATGDAGDLVTFTVVVAQQADATGPLYDLDVTDALGSKYVLVSGSAVASRGVVTETGNTVTLLLSGLALEAADNPGTPGVDESRITLTYQARLADTVQPGEIVPNTASFTGSTTPGGTPGARPFSGSDDAAVTVVMPVTLDKAIIATSVPSTPGSSLTVGETVTARLTATLSEGTQTLVIADTLPAGLEVISTSVAAIGAGVTAGAPSITTSGQGVSFDFGTVVNTGNNIAGDGTVAVEIVARVRDVPGNVNGTTLTNAGTVTITAPDDPQRPGGTQTDQDNTTATVVAPDLVLDKSVPPGFVNPGEVLTYTITLSHTAASTAPAFDILLTDLLTDSNLRLVAGSVTTTLGSVVTGNGAGDTTLSIGLDELALGSSVTITYQATVLPTTPPASLVFNAATADYDSNPGPGGRPGGTGDETVTPVAPGFAKEIASTSNPDTGSGQFDPTAPDLAVGETLTYRLTITLPPGTTNDLVLTDLLPQALLPTAARVASVGSGLTAGAPTISITGQGVRLDFGTVTNGSGIGIGAEDLITVEVDARVIDVAGLAAGASLVNAAGLGFTIDGRTGSLTATAPADLVDPALTIDKTVNRLTGDAGDTFTYTVTVAQGPSSSADAYDIRVTDALDPRLILVSASSTAGTVGTTGNTVTLDLARLALNAAPVVLTYTVRMADTVEPGSVIGNTANLGWDSNPGPGGRPGTGTDSAPDLTAVFGLGLDKTIVATSLTGTTAGAIQPGTTDLAIGETVTYEIVARLSEGTQRVVIADTMPTGFLPVSATVVTTGGSISAGLSGTLTPTATITGQGITFDFGTLVNAGDNLSDAGDLVTVRITARVLDAAINTTGRLATNDATGTISSPTDPGAPGGTVTNQDSVTAAVVEPALDLAKAVDRTTGDAGDVFTYTLTLTTLPGATGPAYNVVIEDPLAAALIVVPGSLSASFGTATIIGNAIRVTIAELPPNAQPITITYQAAFADTIEPGQIVPNTATLAYSSAPTDGRSYGDSASRAVTGTFDFSLDKAIVATSLTGTTAGAIQPGVTDLAIGETVTYELVARLSEGTQRLVISDTMPTGFLPLTATVVTTGASISAGTGGTLTPTGTITGQGITFDFGTLVNSGDNVRNAGDLVTVRITARVLDESINTAGRVATNDATGTISSPTNPTAPGGTLTDGASVSAAVVEPSLDIAKAVDRTTGDAGDVFTYTLTLTTLPGATGPAYNVVIEDPLAAALVVVPGSLSASFGTATIVGNAIRVTIAELPPNAQPITITYQAAFADTIEPGQVVPNTVSLGYSSAPIDGRAYADSASQAITGTFTLGLDKAIVATSLVETSSGRIQAGLTDLAIGEVVTYELVARLSEGTQCLVVTDTMPTGLLPLTGGTAVITTGGSISAGLSGTLTPTATISGQTVTFDFGTLVNRGDNVSDAGDLVTIRIAARVQDLPVNTEGRLLTNDAGATASSPSNPGVPGGTLTAADDVTAAVVIPRFDMTKAVDRTTGDAGQVFTYTLVIRPEAGNTGPAYNILVEDPLSPLLVAVPGSITTTAGTATLVGNTIRISIPVLATDAAPVTVTYQAAFADAIEPSQVVPNTAGLAYSTAPTDGRGFTDSASASVQGVFTLALDKQVVATSLPETGSSFFNPALPDVAAGETVTYWLTATLSEGTQRLVITDTLPTGLTAESARLVSLSPGITAAAPAIALSAGSVTFDFGTVVNTGNNTTGDQVVVEVIARAGPGLSAPGTVLPNTATASATSPSSPGNPGGTLTATDGDAVEAVAAALVFDKSVGKAVLGLGESTTYTLVLSHAAGSTAPAYAVVLSDPLSDPSLSLITGSVTTTAGTVTQGNNGGDTGVTVTLPVLLPGETLTVTFLVRTIGIPIPDGIAPNTAVFDSTSAPGALPPGFGRPITGQDTAEVQIVSGGAPVLGALLPGLDDGLRRLAFNPYTAPIILTGTAQPGSTVTLGLSQAGVGPLGIGSTQVDVGGNWLAILPEPVVPRFDEIAFQELREVVGRIPAYSWNMPSVTPLDGPAGRGADPYTFIASNTVSPANLGGVLGAPVTATFAGAVGPGGYFTGAAGALGGSPGMGLPGAAVNGNLTFNAYALDFLAAHVRAGALGR